MTLPIKCTDGYAGFCAGCLNTTQPLLEAVSVPQMCINHSKPRDSDHRGEGHLTQTRGKERASWKRSQQDRCKEATDLTRSRLHMQSFSGQSSDAGEQTASLGLCEKGGVTETRRGARGGMVWSRRLKPNPRGQRAQGAELRVWLYLKGSSLKFKYMRKDT